MFTQATHNAFKYIKIYKKTLINKKAHGWGAITRKKPT